MQLQCRCLVLLVTGGIVLSSPLAALTAGESVVDDQPGPASTLSGVSMAASSPGIQIGWTSYDIQQIHAMGRQIAKAPGGGTVHFCWTLSSDIPVYDILERYATYNSWDIATGTLNQGPDGTTIALAHWARSGFCRIDADAENHAHMAFHQRSEPSFPYAAWRVEFPYVGWDLHLDYEVPLGVPPWRESLYPNMAVQHLAQSGSGPVIHVIAIPGADLGGGLASIYEHLRYWRYDAGAPVPAWVGPVIIDSSNALSWVIDADDNSDRVALAFETNYLSGTSPWIHNIACYESQTGGLGWLDRTEIGEANRIVITSYNDTLGPMAWAELSIAYDHTSDLHLIWVEQRTANVGSEAAIRHWSRNRGTIRPVAYGYHSNNTEWYRQLNLAQVSLGVGDGSTPCRGGTETNEDYLYALYLKLGGETPVEQADTSIWGSANGELYLTVSHDGGDHWSLPINLTNTKTPDCQPVDPFVPGPGDCASESWASLARHVDDIHIEYIMDREADAFYTGWTINPVMYLNLPAGTTDDPYLCGLPTPVLSSRLDIVESNCGFVVSAGDTISATLWIANSGDGLLEGSLVVGYPDSSDSVGWLSVDDDQSLAYVIPPEDSVAFKVLADATALPAGDYEAYLTVTHNDHLILGAAVHQIRLGVGRCPCHGDPQCDGVPDVLDVVLIIGVAFRSDPVVYDPICDYARTDVTCDGITNVLDAVRMINVVFRGADASAQFCDPCAP